MEIRPLYEGDVAAYRALRLEALRAHPEAFSSAWESESAQDDAWFAQRIQNNAIFGAFDGAALCGFAGFYAQAGQKTGHKGTLWGLYVQPDARCTGVAKRLVAAVIDHAKQHVSRLHLTVVNTNIAAVRLYELFGFFPYGIERDALRTGGKSYDEVLMVLEV